MELKNKKILFLGDSITEGAGSSSVEKRFTDLVAADTGAVSVNYGIGGTRIARQIKLSDNPRWEQDFISRVATMDAEADVVVVFGGTNDWGHGDAALGDFESRDVYTFYGALHVLYKSLIEKYPSATIVILTPLHRVGENDRKVDPARPNNVRLLKEYVDAIREVAEYYSLPVLDLYKVSGLQPEVQVIKETYMPDGLHPNDAGYRILANKVIAFLKSV